MKARIIVDLNERTQKPSVNANVSKFYKPNDIIEIIDIVNGDEYDGNSIWYQLENKAYVWSGGVEGLIDITLRPEDTEQKGEIPSQAYDWWHEEYKIQELWKGLGTKGEGVKIAVLDSGIDQEHPYFDSSKITCSNIWDETSNAPDTNGHGTQVSSILIANGAKMVGIAPDVNLHMIRILNQAAKVKDLVDGINKIPEDTDIVCISQTMSKLDNTEDTQLITDALSKLKTSLIVCGAGNSSSRERYFENLPAALSNVTISVASLKKGRTIATASAMSNNINIAAPGENVKCLLPGKPSYFGPASGTSFSTPFVAGLFALGISYLRKNGQQLSFSEIKSALLDKSLESKDPKKLYGNGIVNTSEFMKQIKSL